MATFVLVPVDGGEPQKVKADSLEEALTKAGLSPADIKYPVSDKVEEQEEAPVVDGPPATPETPLEEVADATGEETQESKK